MLNKVLDAVTMKEFVEEARRMVEQYGWQKMTVTPYGFNEKVTVMLDRMADYEKYEKHSQNLLRQEANGLVRILNKWEEYENCPKVRVRVLRTGKITEVPQEDVDVFVAAKICELV